MEGLSGSHTETRLELAENLGSLTLALSPLQSRCRASVESGWFSRAAAPTGVADDLLAPNKGHVTELCFSAEEDVEGQFSGS